MSKRDWVNDQNKGIRKAENKANPEKTPEVARTEGIFADGEFLPARYPKREENPAVVYLARLGAGSHRTIEQSLHEICYIATGGITRKVKGKERHFPRISAGSFPWGELRYQHTAAIRARLLDRKDPYAPATANKILAALRGVMKEAWRLGQMTADDLQRAADLKPVAATQVMRGRALSYRELQSVYEVCREDETPAGARDAAIILGCCYGAGLRRSEIVRLDLADWDSGAGSLRIRNSKSGSRIVYIGNGGEVLLSRWLKVRGSDPGALFYAVNRNGEFPLAPADSKKKKDARPELQLRGMGPEAIFHLIRKRAMQARIRKSFSPHDLRRSYISDLIDAGADMFAVRRLAGHASVATTDRYDRRGDRSMKRAAAMLNVPCG